MDKDQGAAGLVCLLLVFAAFFCFMGYMAGYSRATFHVQQEAIDNHAASWECDQKSGATHIKWHSSRYGDQ